MAAKSATPYLATCETMAIRVALSARLGQASINDETLYDGYATYSCEWVCLSKRNLCGLGRYIATSFVPDSRVLIKHKET
jgi:hypothetical protein